MTAPRVLSVASAGFEAARQVDVLPAGHRCRGLHGHSFQATVFAELGQGWAAFPGGEIEALEQRLQQAVAPLNYSHLNQVLETPTDENLARWLHRALGGEGGEGDDGGVPGLQRVAVQSTAHQGVDLDRQGMAHVWRRFRFQAAHQLPRVPLGHKCGRMHGHGFEAQLHANQNLGARPLSIDYDHIDALWAPLHMQLNYRCLNEIEGLDNPTSEMISAWIWDRLKPELPELSWVTVFETASCGANFDGSHYRIWKDFSLDSALRLQRAPAGAPQARVHGHSYTLRLHLNAPLDPVRGWTVDFGEVKDIFDPLFKQLDHHALHGVDGLADGDPATLAAWVLAQAGPSLPGLQRVDVYATPGCGAVVAHAIDGPAMPV